MSRQTLDNIGLARAVPAIFTFIPVSLLGRHSDALGPGWIATSLEATHSVASILHRLGHMFSILYAVVSSVLP